MIWINKIDAIHARYSLLITDRLHKSTGHLPSSTLHYGNPTQLSTLSECDSIYTTCFSEPICSMHSTSVLIKHVLYVNGLLCRAVHVTVKLCQHLIWSSSHMSRGHGRTCSQAAQKMSVFFLPMLSCFMIDERLPYIWCPLYTTGSDHVCSQQWQTKTKKGTSCMWWVTSV